MTGHGRITNFALGAAIFFRALGDVITWHRAVASVSDCGIYIIPLQLGYEYDDIMTQRVDVLVVGRWGGGGGASTPAPPPPAPPPPKYAHVNDDRCGQSSGRSLARRAQPSSISRPVSARRYEVPLCSPTSTGAVHRRCSTLN